MFIWFCINYYFFDHRLRVMLHRITFLFSRPIFYWINFYIYSVCIEIYLSFCIMAFIPLAVIYIVLKIFCIYGTNFLINSTIKLGLQNLFVNPHFPLLFLSTFPISLMNSIEYKLARCQQASRNDSRGIKIRRSEVIRRPKHYRKVSIERTFKPSSGFYFLTMPVVYTKAETNKIYLLWNWNWIYINYMLCHFDIFV